MHAKRLVQIGAVLLAVSAAVAASKIPKRLKAGANPEQYAAFGKPLDKEQEIHHALDRLTFGPRPGDYERAEKLGVKRFVEVELNPQKVPENPVLLERLRPFDSLRLSISDTRTRYPDPRMIAQVARGEGKLPEDPELRAIVVYLANRYLEKKAVTAGDAGKDSDDEAGLDRRMKLAQLLRPEQIAALEQGTPDEKRAVLASVPRLKMVDFVWALPKQERNQLTQLAPVELRREMMLATNPRQLVLNDLMEGKLLRAIYSDHQLEELMVDFWYNHFNVFVNKGADRYFVPTYEREAIRPHVFGKFKDLLLATAKSPAMLFYLDNWESVAPDAVAANARSPKRVTKRGLNENYGRELLELHTLGVDGGYTQQDVVEVARCFTGWTISGPRKGMEFTFDEKVHDQGKKIVLGHVIPAGGGMEDGLKVIDILAHHPSTAQFISLKLAKRFVADDPPPTLVNRMAQAFTTSGGDIREVLRTMLQSPEFWSEGAYRAKVKTPFEMIVSAIRATSADVQSAYLLAQEIQRLGEPLYRKIEPTGYSSANAEWVSSASLLDRMNFALALAHNHVAGVKVDTSQWQAMSKDDPMRLARYILEENPSEQTRAAIEKTLNDPERQKQLLASANAGAPQTPSLVAGLVLGSPEFQRR